MKSIVLVALSMIAYAVISPSLPYVSGHFYPVVGNVEIDTKQVAFHGGQWTEIAGRADKLRDCEFVEIRWFLDQPGDLRVRAQVRFFEAAKSRREGDFTFGPWVVQLTDDQLLRQSSANVVHKCHPLWLTITPFWRSIP